MRAHGKVATYNDGCRCAECKDASADARRRAPSRRHRQRHYPSGRPSPRDDPRWMDAAACRTEPLDVFFPGTTDYGPAKALCASCGVRGECLAYALATDQPDGVWGGLSFDERQHMRTAS